MTHKSNLAIATMGIDIGKNSFHVVGLKPGGGPRWSGQTPS
jgi:hypothetical protein